MTRSHRNRRRRGGFPLVRGRKTTPSSRIRMLREILLSARPPLLAVMQGGEYDRPNSSLIQYLYAHQLSRGPANILHRHTVHTSMINRTLAQQARTAFDGMFHDASPGAA